MKIALCFSGQPRGLSIAHSYYKTNLLDFYDVDVFCHSWNSDLNDKILSLYRPKDYLFENAKFTEEDNLRYTNTPDPSKWPPRFTLSAFYSINESKKLFQKFGVEYDFVIKTRYDYALNVKIPFEELSNKKLYMPNCRMVPERNFGNDQFAFSSGINMGKYMSTYENIDLYYSKGTAMIGEEMLKANLIHNDLVGENLIYVDMNNPFPPGPYNGTWHSLVREDYQQWT